MLKKLFTLTLCILLIAQTSVAIADLHGSWQSGSDYLESGVLHDADVADSELLTDSSEHDCHHCGHCHGHVHSAIPSKGISFNVNGGDNSHLSSFPGYPSRFAFLLFRPPIT